MGTVDDSMVVGRPTPAWAWINKLAHASWSQIGDLAQTRPRHVQAREGALGPGAPFHRCSLIPQAQEALAAEANERGRRVVLVVDEAHLLGAESRSALRPATP